MLKWDIILSVVHENVYKTLIVLGNTIKGI